MLGRYLLLTGVLLVGLLWWYIYYVLVHILHRVPGRTLSGMRVPLTYRASQRFVSCGLFLSCSWSHMVTHGHTRTPSRGGSAGLRLRMTKTACTFAQLKRGCDCTQLELVSGVQCFAGNSPLQR